MQKIIIALSLITFLAASQYAVAGKPRHSGYNKRPHHSFHNRGNHYGHYKDRGHRHHHHRTRDVFDVYQYRRYPYETGVTIGGYFDHTGAWVTTWGITTGR